MRDRDPRVDPRPGDELRRLNKSRRCIGRLAWVVDFTDERGVKGWATLDAWRRWGRGARVSRRA